MYKHRMDQKKCKVRTLFTIQCLTQRLLFSRATERSVLTSTNASIRTPTNVTTLTEFASTLRAVTNADASLGSESRRPATRVLVSAEREEEEGKKKAREDIGISHISLTFADIDECKTGIANCTGLCRNTLGSYICFCKTPDGCWKTPTTAPTTTLNTATTTPNTATTTPNTATTTPNTATTTTLSTASCSSWSTWGNCKGSCGGSGLQERSRTCSSSHTGASVEKRVCKMPPCRPTEEFGVSKLEVELLFSKKLPENAVSLQRKERVNLVQSVFFY